MPVGHLSYLEKCLFRSSAHLFFKKKKKNFYFVCQSLSLEALMESSFGDGTDTDKIVSASEELPYAQG